MHIGKAAEKLNTISDILEKIKKSPIPANIVSMKEQRAMRERIKAVFDLYSTAIKTKKKHIFGIRKEASAIISTLEKWLNKEEQRADNYYTDTVCGGCFKGLL